MRRLTVPSVVALLGVGLTLGGWALQLRHVRCAGAWMYVIGAGTAAIFTPLGRKAARTKGVAVSKESSVLILQWVVTLLMAVVALTFLPEAVACIP